MEDKQFSSHLSILCSRKHAEEEQPSDDFSKPRKGHYRSKWETTRDAVSCVKLARAQDQGLQFWQTRSNAVIVYNSVPSDCIYKVVSQEGERTFIRETLDVSTSAKSCTRKFLPTLLKVHQPAAGNRLRGTSRKQKEDQGDPTEDSETSHSWKRTARSELSVGEKPEFKVDLRIEGIAHDVILPDEERMGQIQVVVG